MKKYHVPRATISSPAAALADVHSRPDSLFQQEYDYSTDLTLLEELLASQDEPFSVTAEDFAVMEQSPVVAHPDQNDHRDRRSMRKKLLAPEYQRLEQLEVQVGELQAQLRDRDALIRTMAPLISQMIAQRVQESRDEVAEALYPVIGRTIQRAVSEAMRDLARRIDLTLRRSMRPRFLIGLILKRLRGVKPEEMTLRQALPFQVREIFLLHRESGLLIQHVSAVSTLTDADLIGSMLSAIRAYVADSFEPGNGTSLDAIEYGSGKHILIEEGQSALLAVLIQGVEPAGFRAALRQQLFELHHTCGRLLRTFNGDPIDAAVVLPRLNALMEWSDASA